MENKDMKNKVDVLLDQISKANKELEEIRKTCKHPEVEIRDIMTPGSRVEIRKVCKCCKKVVGYPTTNELKEYVKL